VAVKPETGELKWYFQMVPGDEWDYDSVQQLLLADIMIKGQLRKVIMQANKDGFYYVLDRVTGEFISGQPYARVTWAKGLNEETGRPIVNKESYYGSDSIAIAPGAGGGHNWSPMSFNPATGLVYIPTTTTSTTTFAVDPNFEYKPGRSNTGIVRANRGGARLSHPTLRLPRRRHGLPPPLCLLHRRLGRTPRARHAGCWSPGIL
jgi:quinohemoprotein ethanol dehydrogenase